MTRRLLAVLAVLSVCSCTKVRTDCLYTIVPHVQDEKGGPESTPQDLGAFALYGSAEKWSVLCYEDAAQGIFTDTLSGAVRTFSLSATQQQDGNIALRLTSSPAVLVVVFPQSRSYAWREVTLAENLWTLTVPLRFRTWRYGESYAESRWNMVSGPAPPQEDDQAAEQENF